MKDIEYYFQKVLVVVKGGIVQSIYASNTMIEVDIFDLDNEAYENRLSEEEELIKRSKGLLPLI